MSAVGLRSNRLITASKPHCVINMMNPTLLASFLTTPEKGMENPPRVRSTVHNLIFPRHVHSLVGGETWREKQHQSFALRDSNYLLVIISTQVVQKTTMSKDRWGRYIKKSRNFEFQPQSRYRHIGLTTTSWQDQQQLSFMPIHGIVQFPNSTLVSSDIKTDIASPLFMVRGKQFLGP